jgi:hypothetical protein
MVEVFETQRDALHTSILITNAFGKSRRRMTPQSFWSRRDSKRVASKRGVTFRSDQPPT